MKLHGVIKDYLKELREKTKDKGIKGYIILDNTYDLYPLISITKKNVYYLKDKELIKLSSQGRVKGIYETEDEAIVFLKEAKYKLIELHNSTDYAIKNIERQIK